ncbi:MAG: helix-turn-helix domain-containing protein [Sediminibacterium sp.]
MQVGKKIAAARKLKGLTQEELADLSQITVRTIQRIEAGNNTPQSFTLKAIAKALELDYADLLTNTNTVSAGNNGTAADMRHIMTLLNFSCFTYVVIPWVHWLIPMQVLKRRKDISGDALSFAQQIIRRQIYWTVAINLTMLGTLAYNYTVVSVMGNKNAVMPYLWPFLLLYFINATVILVQHRTIRMRF